MNRSLLIGFIGALIGSAITSLYWNNKCENILIDLDKVLDGYVETRRKNRKTEHEQDRERIKRFTPFVSSDMDEISIKNGNGDKVLVMNKDRYKKVARRYDTQVDPAELQSPTEDNYMNNWEDPRVISFEDFCDDEVGYDKLTITYYEGDDTLADDEDEIIDYRVGLVGEVALDSFGMLPGDQYVVYVRNGRISVDYEIIKVEGKYSEIVIGK